MARHNNSQEEEMNTLLSTKFGKGAVGVFLALLSISVAALSSQREGANLFAAQAETVRFEVSENGKKFTPDETPVFADGLPAYGNEFITEGYIYPEGTLSGSNGVNPDGSPEFPNKVLGRWYCRGWHVGNGAHTVTGPIVITHQLFDLGNKPGKNTIASDGIELADMNVPFKRAVTGGTGQFALARGEQTQTLLAFPNNAGGVNLRIEISVETK
jgi:hypothetical protein